VKWTGPVADGEAAGPFFFYRESTNVDRNI
jgi:hypothetical protein